MATFEASVSLRCIPEDVFDFLVQTVNIRRISPPEMDLAFVDAPEVLELGSRLKFKVQGFGRVQQIVHEITEFDRPRGFTERQVEGPLEHWIHEHMVEVSDSGDVVVVDRIEFKPPGGLVGLLVTESRILESLDDGFSHRHTELQRILDPSRE